MQGCACVRITEDWKRAKKISMENAWGNMMHPLGHLPAANYWAYALQVNVYGLILEQEYGMRVDGYFLAQVHPDAGARLISCPRMDAEMRAIHDHEMQCGRAGAPRAGACAPF